MCDAAGIGSACVLTRRAGRRIPMLGSVIALPAVAAALPSLAQEEGDDRDPLLGECEVVLELNPCARVSVEKIDAESWYPHALDTLGRGCVQQVLRDTATLVADGLGRADLTVRSSPPVREARGRTVRATDSQPVCSGPAQGSGRGRAGWAPGSALGGQGWAQAPSPAQPSCTV
ncbi:hypothetical protein [Pseudonocardia abyssalis]|uniref:Uncharacterized protein n=1 Tax=Pseudonocardia abyssalis TaxID=2792008 RepID=A0ABS6ULM8_9PSEU|nr:hypothetical protein [Pseudonocardia abyssalis]MBW0115068.1 hypothetical protein [Pseudonocardia abyssalis]MBW0133163.1 hypothetical protein [Pseudonocardia abyssalis]